MYAHLYACAWVYAFLKHVLIIGIIKNKDSLILSWH